MLIMRSSSPATMTTGICKAKYSPRKAKAFGIISADSAALARTCEGRSAISFGKPRNFSGMDLGPKILRINKGHINLPKRGASVWRMMSPRTGTAGHLRQILCAYAGYYNGTRTHRSLHKDAPKHRPTQRIGIVRSRPILG